MFPKLDVTKLSYIKVSMISNYKYNNSKFPVFTTVQKNWSDTILVFLPCCFKDKLCFPAKTPPNTMDFFQALPILALTTSDAPSYKLKLSPR